MGSTQKNSKNWYICREKLTADLAACQKKYECVLLGPIEKIFGLKNRKKEAKFLMITIAYSSIYLFDFMFYCTVESCVRAHV